MTFKRVGSIFTFFTVNFVRSISNILLCKWNVFAPRSNELEFDKWYNTYKYTFLKVFLSVEWNMYPRFSFPQDFSWEDWSQGVMVAGQIRFPIINWFLSHQFKNDLWFQWLYSQTKHWAPDEMFASYWMMAMSGLVITRLTAQIPRITSREWRVVSRGVRGCRMLMYLGKQIK